MKSIIGSKRTSFWQENGFLVFPGFFTEDEVDTVRDAYDRTWESTPSWVVVDDLVTNRRCHMSELDESERRHHFKVNDLYLTEVKLREVALSEKLGMVLEELLGDEPSICNTLNFDKGSQQADHVDTLYMTPGSDFGLVATWMALEDTTSDAGPLRYYPGSNHISPFRFSNGSMHQVDQEVPQWCDYMAEQVENLGLEEQRFLACKGDLFIWHAVLLHGGSEIANLTKTRQSLVTHYWTETDSARWDLRPAPGGWWIKKPPLNVPDANDPHPIEDTGEGDPIDFPTLVTEEAPTPGRELRERMDALQGATS